MDAFVVVNNNWNSRQPERINLTNNKQRNKIFTFETTKCYYLQIRYKQIYLLRFTT